MTDTTTDPLREFLHALPGGVRRRLRLPDLAVAMVHAACRDHDWTPAQLARHVGDGLGDVINPTPRVVDRLRACAKQPAQAKTARPGRLCGRCEHGWVYDDDTGTVTRCPCRTTERTTT